MRYPLRGVSFTILAVAFPAAMAAACGSSSSSPNDTGGAGGGANAGGGAGGGLGVDAAVDSTAPDTGADTGPTGDASGSADSGDAALPLGAPITATPGQWTWVPFANSACSDGSATGIGIYPNTASDKVLVFLDGGGACWDYATCFELHTAVLGPFGATQFASTSSSFGGTVLDPTSAQNPFKDYSLVFVPYCTADVHAGDNVIVYSNGTDGGAQTMHHVGRANVAAYLARLGPTFKTSSEVAFTGSSAGGGGALFNYPLARAYWPNATMILVDDSLPLFEGSAIPDAFKAAWIQNWALASVTDPICGTACRTDMSIFMKDVAKLFPNDRMALLSSEQDQTISSYFLLTGAQFQADLASLTTDVLDPSGNFKHFYVAGQTHTMLGNPASFTTAGGTQLQTWLGQMATGDPAWASAGP